jgi:hypothetical protein
MLFNNFSLSDDDNANDGGVPIASTICKIMILDVSLAA